jgi:hypothetical protein
MWNYPKLTENVGVFSVFRRILDLAIYSSPFLIGTVRPFHNDMD